VALLSYPVPMLPVIQLLTPQRTESVLPSQASTSTRDLAVRLSLLLLSTLIALLVPDFGRIASILGCVNLAGCQVADLPSCPPSTTTFANTVGSPYSQGRTTF